MTIAMLDVALHFFWPDAMMDKTALDPEVRPPQVLANNALVLYQHPAIGMLRQRRSHASTMSTPVTLRPDPLLGEHTLEVLTEEALQIVRPDDL